MPASAARYDGTSVRQIGDEGPTTERKIICNSCYGDDIVRDTDAAMLQHEQTTCVHTLLVQTDDLQSLAVVR